MIFLCLFFVFSIVKIDRWSDESVTKTVELFCDKFWYVGILKQDKLTREFLIRNCSNLRNYNTM